MKYEEKILSELYHTNGSPRVSTGSVLITSPSSTGAGGKILRLEKDIRELVSRSEFHVSSTPSKHVVAEIVIGETVRRSDKPCIYAGYSQWDFYVGSKPYSDKIMGLEMNPITSLFVAGLVASEVFRIRFNKETVFQPTEKLSGKLVEGEGIMHPYPTSLDFQGKRVSWFGCGSLSYYVVHALDGINEVNGTFHMVDPSLINVSNNRKYVGLTPNERKKSKAKVLSQVLKNKGISTKPFQMSINDYARIVDFEIPLAICAVDSSIARRDLQAKLPETILNGWTGGYNQTLFTGVGRHSFDGEEECLNCAYWTDIEGTPNFVDLSSYLNTNSMYLYDSLREGMPMPRTAKRPYRTEERFLDGYFNACENYSINTGPISRDFSIPFISAIGGSLLALSIVSEGSTKHAPNRLHGQRIRFTMAPKFSSYGWEPTAARKNCICPYSSELGRVL